MDREKSQQLLQTLVLIWYIQLASCAMFAGIVWLEFIPREEGAAGDPLLSSYLLPAIGLGMVFFAPILRRLLTSGLHRSDVTAGEKQQKYLFATIISLVFAESAAVIGFVSWLLGGSKDTSIALCAAAAVAVFLCAPKDLELQ